MRPRLIAGTSLLAMLFLVLALKGEWGEALAPGGALLKVTLQGITQVTQRDDTLPVRDCSYLRGRGAVQLCAPSEGGAATFSMLCAAFPLLVTGLLFAAACAGLTIVSPYGRRATAAAFAGAGFAAVLGGTTLAIISMRPALSALDGLQLQLGSVGYTAAWIALGFLAFSAALSTTSTMLGHT